MKKRMLGSALAAGAVALTLAGTAGAGDLKGVSRAIGKQPTYAGTPAYGLLVFGADMKSRVWIVVDGSTLYVDKNGNGDLTEASEKVSLAGEPDVEENEVLKATTSEFPVGDLPVATGAPTYKELTVTRFTMEPKAGAPAELKASSGLVVRVSYGQDVEQAASPNLSAKAEDAPIVHFDGSLTATAAAGCEGPTTVLYHGENDQELTVQIGTQGLGSGTWAPVSYGLVPESVHPVLEIAFPAAAPGGAPIVTKYTLDARC